MTAKSSLVLLASITLAFGAMAMNADAKGHGPYYGGGHHTTSHGGHYSGNYGGSSHKGGHYRNIRTSNRYGRHKPGHRVRSSSFDGVAAT